MVSGELSAASLPLVLLGAGGHAKVLLSMMLELGRRVYGVCDPQLASQSVSCWRGLPVLGGDDAIDRFDPTSVALVNGVGQLVGNKQRQILYSIMKNKGFNFATLVHPTAYVDTSAKLGEGVQIMAGAVVQADCIIDVDTILNTRASLDHDCHVGRHVHIAPGVTVCGAVQILDEGFIGSGTVIIPGIHIGKGAVVGAGSIVLKNVASGKLFLNNRDDCL